MYVYVCVYVCIKQKNRKKGGWVHNQQRPEAGLVGKGGNEIPERPEERVERKGGQVSWTQRRPWKAN